MGLHWQELVVILLIVLVLFGPRKLPEVGRSLGRGIREFRDSFTGKGGALDFDDNDTDPKKVPVKVEIERDPSPKKNK